MIAGLKPYVEIKDSGVAWLGSVPAHWEVRRTKYLLKERDSRSLTGTEQLLRVSQYTGVTERKRADELDGPDTRAASLVGYKQVSPSNLVVNIMLAWNGSMGVSAFEGICSPAYCVYRFGADAIPMYFHHLLRSPAYRARIKALSRGVVDSRLRLYTDDLFRLEALLPPRDEQTAIVRFLDHADRRIRRAIAAKQKLIRLLEEQKQAIIHRTVTRGLDPAVRLKVSGVEWLGDVPEHWEVSKIRHFATVGNGSTPSRGRSDYWVGGTFPWLNSSVANRRLVSGSDQFVTETALRECHLPVLHPGCVLVAITGQGKTRGKATVLEIEATINQHLAYISLRNDAIRPAFLQLVLSAAYRTLRSISDDSGSTKGALTCADLRHFKVTIPPVEEQDEILRFVDAESVSIDLAVDRAKQESVLLNEYRTRLVADVVTGKLDVREAAARLPESPEPETPEDEELDADDDALLGEVVEGAEA